MVQHWKTGDDGSGGGGGGGGGSGSSSNSNSTSNSNSLFPSGASSNIGAGEEDEAMPLFLHRTMSKYDSANLYIMDSWQYMVRGSQSVLRRMQQDGWCLQVLLIERMRLLK
jgi:hypothetical protein